MAGQEVAMFLTRLFGHRHDELQRDLAQLRQQNAAQAERLGRLEGRLAQAPDSQTGPRWVPLAGLYVALATLYVTAFGGVADAEEPFAHLVIGGAGIVLSFYFVWVTVREVGLSLAMRIMTAVVGASVLLVGVVELDRWQTLGEEEAAAEQLEENEQAIRDTIIEGTAVELAWYKHPEIDQQAALERYFLPQAQGGDRSGQITTFVNSVLRDRGRRFSDTASRSIFINRISVSPDGESAFVETSEIWYQPLLIIQEDGTEVPVEDVPPDQLNLYTEVQFYNMAKLDGRWYIVNNPAPVAS